MKKRLLIGVIITSCNIEFQEEIIKGIIAQSLKSNCDIAVLTPLNDFSLDTPHKQCEKNIFQLIQSDKFDGFLYNKNTFRNEKVISFIDDLLERSGKPVMLLDSTNHKHFESTAIDDGNAFEKITDHLIDVHGCNKIYCLTGPKKHFISVERMNGFKNSMKKHGLYYDRSSCIYGDFWEDASKELASRIINGEIARPDAVVCGNDHSAKILIDALSEKGINVPDDIAVTGYDASDDAIYSNPSITTFHRPNFQLGAEAFRRLYRIITGKICKKVNNNDGGIILGRSCGCTQKLNVKKKSQRRIKINERLKSDFFNRDMLFDISGAENINDFSDRLINYTYYIYKIKHIEICLTKKYLEFNDSLTFKNGDDVKNIISHSAIKKENDSEDFFSSSDIVSVFSQNRPYPSVYYISPLHFNSNFFGYCAVSFGKELMSFSRLYIYWINYVNNALEHIRIKSMLKNAVYDAKISIIHDENTGLLNKNGMEKVIEDMIKSKSGFNINTYFIRIQITGLNKIYFQNGDEKCVQIIIQLSKFLKECIISNEILGLWDYDTFCIITTAEKRTENIISEFLEKIKPTQFTPEKNCNIDFTVGVYNQEINMSLNLSNVMHKASINRFFNYNISEANLNPQYEKICQLHGEIMKNPEKPWSIDDIADSMYLSKSYLQKIYKTYFGKSIIAEVIEFRIEKAKELLTKTDMTITDISKECGYSSYNYFVRQFKLSEGFSPTEYRLNISEKKCHSS